MSLGSATYYWIVCDECGAKTSIIDAEDDGEEYLQSDPDVARQDALNDGWLTAGKQDFEKHYCARCVDFVAAREASS